MGKPLIQAVFEIDAVPLQGLRHKVGVSAVPYEEVLIPLHHEYSGVIRRNAVLHIYAFGLFPVRVIAEQDGFIEGQQLYSGGLEGEIRVDNSTVTLTNLTSDTQMQIGYSNTWGGMGTNCTLTIAGDHPQISLSGGLALHRCSHLVFELPADGYREGIVPIRADGKIRVLTGSDIRFAGAEEMYAAHAAAENRASYVLAENPSGKDFFSDAAITAAQASLGDRFRLVARVTDGKNQLVLTPRLPTGLMVIIK